MEKYYFDQGEIENPAGQTHGSGSRRQAISNNRNRRHWSVCGPGLRAPRRIHWKRAGDGGQRIDESRSGQSLQSRSWQAGEVSKASPAPLPPRCRRIVQEPRCPGGTTVEVSRIRLRRMPAQREGEKNAKSDYIIIR